MTEEPSPMEVDMKGLIIKDLMCLRKQRVTFIYIVAVVMIVSIMYVLSARFGNIALGNQSMMTENNMTDIDVKNLSSLALVLFMLLPIAMVGDVSAVFIADGKAGFASVSSVLPLSIEKRVLSKYITILAFFGIGVDTDLFISFVLSLLTDIISFKEFFEIIITCASALFIYGALICVYMFVFGYGKESYAQTCSILTIIAILVFANFTKVKMIFLSCFSEEYEVLDVNPLEVMNGFVKDKCLSVFITAVIVGVLSYLLSVFFAKRKRGIV